LNIPSLNVIYAEEARRSLWRFCQVLSPDFYTDDKPHLKTICDTLQSLYEGKLLKSNGTPYRNLNIELPPRHGKSRTLTNFSAWILGKSHENRIITASYNDEFAQQFSRFTRDIISEESLNPNILVYSGIFDARIKHGDAAAHKWALEGQFFNYKGTGIEGSLTGSGSNVLVIDDAVKDAETAYNETALDKIWLWYTGTFLSRAEQGAITIICMTPWCKLDLSARAVASEPDNWYTISMPAFDGENMLCDSILNREAYDRLKKIGDEKIIAANYDMVRIDVKGSLYRSFETYDVLPEETEESIGYTDTADEGQDYLCSIQARKKAGKLYVTDVLFTQEPQEITEVKQADSIIASMTKQIQIESNNGGRAFARNVQRILDERKYSCAVEWFHQSGNKISRILTNAPVVQQFVVFPEGWTHKWPEFYQALMSFQREGKNKHDDAPDCLTGICEKYLIEDFCGCF
jgi:predicted phage terminase large subunit-like protein